ncbi:hypothetical protein FDK21_19650 [Cohaesibacter sp. CAU 1516]|nr:hypothetical protein FDK21_19650 [Cohaesibacter sp. CAU 1516]
MQVRKIHEIRTVTFADKPNDPWFVAADVCRALGVYMRIRNGYEEVRNDFLKKNLNDVEHLLSPIPIRGEGGQRHKRQCVSESDLYRLLMRSDKPEAKQFQDWVTRDVLPAIRKDGMYVKGEEKVLTGEMSLDEMTLKAVGG